MVSCLVRDYQPEDRDALIPIINAEWHFDLYGDNWKELVESYIDEYLSRSDFAKVAVVDDEVAGIVTASVRPHDAEPIEGDLSGNEYLRDKKVMDDIDSLLRREDGSADCGELVLLIVSGYVRGEHIGTLLISSTARYLKRHGCTGMYISTDTDCNYGYYEHLGAKLVGGKDCIVQRKPLRRFLYKLPL